MRHLLKGLSTTLILVAGAAACRGEPAPEAATRLTSDAPDTTIRRLEMQGPIQFILGDSTWEQPRALPVEAFAADGRRVAPLSGAAVDLGDSTLATASGLSIIPRSRGATVVTVRVGNHSTTMGLHIYQRVDALADLDTLLLPSVPRRVFAVPLRLARGETRRLRLPPGSWMLATLPAQDDDPKGLRLRVEGGTCETNLLNIPGRLGCNAGTNTALIVSRSQAGRAMPVVTGHVLIRPLTN